MMLKNKNPIDSKVKTYIDNLFSGVGTSQQLFDLKEELATNIKEKIDDYKSRGMNDDQAFKEAVISMGDLSGLVDDMRELGQNSSGEIVTSPAIFVVTGGTLITYSVLTRETGKKYAMNKIRAALYALSIGLILFSMFVAATTGFATGEVFIAIASLMFFFLAGIGLFLGLILTGVNRRKQEGNSIT